MQTSLLSFMEPELSRTHILKDVYPSHKTHFMKSQLQKAHETHLRSNIWLHKHSMNSSICDLLAW